MWLITINTGGGVGLSFSSKLGGGSVWQFTFALGGFLLHCLMEII